MYCLSTTASHVSSTPRLINVQQIGCLFAFQYIGTSKILALLLAELVALAVRSTDNREGTTEMILTGQTRTQKAMSEVYQCIRVTVKITAAQTFSVAHLLTIHVAFFFFTLTSHHLQKRSFSTRNE